MKKHLIRLFVLSFLSTTALFLQGQEKSKVGIEFKNAPVLFKQNNSSFQQVIANCRVDIPGTILIKEGGKELLKADLKKGGNSFSDYGSCSYHGKEKQILL